jgi:predicted ATPase
MLTRLRFRNFKAWQDSGDVRLARLSVLFGTNSAGKTSMRSLHAGAVHRSTPITSWRRVKE